MKAGGGEVRFVSPKAFVLSTHAPEASLRLRFPFVAPDLCTHPCGYLSLRLAGLSEPGLFCSLCFLLFCFVCFVLVTLLGDFPFIGLHLVRTGVVLWFLCILLYFFFF